MKIFIILAAAGLVLSGPALAEQGARRHRGDQPRIVIQPPHQPQYGEFVYGDRNPNNVYTDGGRYVGSDPDPNIRQQLKNDYDLSHGR
jgi:hypothetical protein